MIHPASDDLVFPTGGEIYDTLMMQIEPELVSANIPLLDAEYVGESEADRALRYERYTRAYATYDKVFQQWQKNLSSSVQVYRREALHSAQDEDHFNELPLIMQIDETIMNNSDLPPRMPPTLAA